LIANKVLKFIGLVSVTLACISTIISVVSGVGIIISLFALLMSGISSLFGNPRYLYIASGIVTFNLFLVSVLMQIENIRESNIILYIGSTYIVTFLFLLIGRYIQNIKKA